MQFDAYDKYVNLSIIFWNNYVYVIIKELLEFFSNTDDKTLNKIGSSIYLFHNLQYLTVVRICMY